MRVSSSFISLKSFDLTDWIQQQNFDNKLVCLTSASSFHSSVPLDLALERGHGLFGCGGQTLLGAVCSSVARWVSVVGFGFGGGFNGCGG